MFAIDLSTVFMHDHPSNVGNIPNLPGMHSREVENLVYECASKRHDPQLKPNCAETHASSGGSLALTSAHWWPGRGESKPGPG
jgi:hypothetical protein